MNTLVRSSFPAIHSDEHKLFCNNEERTHAPMQLIDRIQQYLLEYNVCQTCMHEDSYRATIHQHKAKHFVNELINNVSGDVEFGSSVYQLAYNLSGSIPMEVIESLVICDSMDVSIISFFTPLAKRVKFFHHSGFVSDYEDLFAIVNYKTTLIILPHVSKVTGAVMDIEYIVERVRAINPSVKIMVDGSTYMPHRKVDVYRLGVDFYFFSFNKCFGTDMSGVYIKDIRELDILDERNPENMLEMGSRLEMLKHGLLGLEDYIDCVTKSTESSLGVTESSLGVTKSSLGVTKSSESNTEITTGSSYDRIDVFYNLVYEQEEALTDYFVHEAKKLDQLFTLLTDHTKDRVPIFALQFKGYSNQFVTLFLNECNVVCDYGDFNCEMMFHDHECRDCVRVSLVHYNTTSELEYFFNLMKELNKAYTSSSESIVLSMNDPPCILYQMSTIKLSEAFMRTYNFLSKDVYHQSLIKYSLYSMVYTKTNAIVGNNRYIQPNSRKSSMNQVRHYQPINVIHTDEYATVVKMFMDFVYEQTLNTPHYLLVHQIRLTVKNGLCEDISRFGFSYVGILCVNSVNVTNAELTLYEEVIHNPVFSCELTSGKMITFNDRKLMHKLHNFEKTNLEDHTDAYMDLLIISTLY